MASVPISELDSVSRLILYSINAAEGVALDNTHLQKIIFQTLKIIKELPDELRYRAHHYGPYSDMVEEEKTSLIEMGYLVESDKKIRIPLSELSSVKSITPPSNEAGFRIRNMVKDLTALNVNELLLMIYFDDIESTGGIYLENSEVKDGIMAKRESIAMEMYRGKKVSLGRASELAGLNIRDFKDKLMKRYGVIYVD